MCHFNVKFIIFEKLIYDVYFFNLLPLTCRLCPAFTLFFFYFLLFCLVYNLYVRQLFFFFFGLFWFLFLCFGSIETPKHAVSIFNRNNWNKRLVSDSTKSFGSSFGCFKSKLVSQDTLTPRINISHDAVSEQLSYRCKSTRALECRVQILSESLNHGSACTLASRKREGGSVQKREVAKYCKSAGPLFI
jgi:hypothetical protein